MPLTLTRELARRIDQQAIDQYGMTSVMLMENAGRGATDLICRLGIAGPVAICCGTGNNAGDGFVIARHLDLRGHEVRVLLLTDADRITGDAALNFKVIERSGISIKRWQALESLSDELAGCQWIVDAILGTGAHGAPRPPFDEAIELLNASGVPILAVDLPSGMDCDTGAAEGPCIRALHTCTFVAPKRGFGAPGTDLYTGTIHVVDIGAPRKLIDEIVATQEGGK